MSNRGFSAAELGKLAAHGSLYISREEQVDGVPWLLPYAHYLHQAWEDLSLAGVLCVDGRPTVYICERKTISPAEAQVLQKYTWNQGVVPLLILLSDAAVQVHSAVKRPLAPIATTELIPEEPPSFIQAIEISAMAVQGASLIRSIETGQYFQDHAAFFPASETVDASLVSNLLHTARKLKAVECPGWTQEQSHSLLGRILFVKFLEARGFIKPLHFPDQKGSLEAILATKPLDEAKRLLYREFFGRMKQEFNGTMFDDQLKQEERLIRRGHLGVVSQFLSVADMDSGQQTFGFWIYDFRCIPVEIISSIYEEFMKGEDLQKKRKDGAVYTPRHLTETTLHIALEGRYNQCAAWRVLDPACGSGIFLGAMFNLLSTQWLRENPNARKATKAKGLLNILLTQIRGVDINPVACRIAAFSLYLALFEKLRPMDLDEFKEKVRPDKFLPSLLWYPSSEENPEQPVIFCGDFLNDALPLETDVDLIIGNPPWTGRAETQIALHFTRRTPQYLRSGGMGCLLLPSTILVNSNGVLDSGFFGSVKVEKIVQLADFRKVLFHATHPCFVLRFLNEQPSSQDVIAYETPKLNRYDRRRGVIVVEPDDQKLVPFRAIMQAAAEGGVQAIWSRKFWGSPRDEAFLRRLDAYSTLAEAKQTMKWGGGVGFKPCYPDISRDQPKSLAPDWSPEDPFIANNNHFPELVVHKDSLSTLGVCLSSSFVRKLNKAKDGSEVSEKIYAAADAVQYKPASSVFRGPLIVFSEGFTKFAFSPKLIRFEHSLRSLTGNSSEDAELLRFLTVILSSRLMAYHAFHCGSSNGIGREKLHLSETMALPFPLPHEDLAVADSALIVKKAAEIILRLERTGSNLGPQERASAAASARAELEPLVEAYYGVSDTEKLLIADTLDNWKPSIHKTNLDGKIPALAFPGLADRKTYAEILCGELEKFSQKKGIRINAEGKVSAPLNLVLVTVIFGNKKTNYQETEETQKFWEALQAMDSAATRENGNLHYLRGFSYFENDRVHILKPATLRNWSRTAALNDADAIYEHQITHRA